MKTCVCDICGKSLPLDNQMDVTILGIALDLCPECSTWAKGMPREEQVDTMLLGFRKIHKFDGPIQRDVDGSILVCAGPSPVTAPREGTGGTARPPEAGTGGKPSCE